jgi:hypothetical protein
MPTLKNTSMVSSQQKHGFLASPNPFLSNYSINNMGSPSKATKHNYSSILMAFTQNQNLNFFYSFFHVSHNSKKP